MQPLPHVLRTAHSKQVEPNTHISIHTYMYYMFITSPTKPVLLLTYAYRAQRAVCKFNDPLGSIKLKGDKAARHTLQHIYIYIGVVYNIFVYI